MEDIILDTVLPSVADIDEGILALGGADGGTFIVTASFHPQGESYFQVQFSEVPTTINASGWSAKIDDVPSAITFQSISGRIVTFSVDKVEIDQLVYMSYNGAGNTIFEGTQLKPFSNVKVSQTLTGDIRWLAAGSPYMLTDGDDNTGDAHLLHGQYLGEGLPTFNTTNSVYLPDHENIYRQAGAGDPPWLGARMVKNFLRNSQDLTGSPWTINCDIQTGFTDPLGGDTAFRMTGTQTNGSLQNSFSLPNEGEYRNSVWLRRVSGTGQIQLKTTAAANNPITASVTGEWQRFTSPVDGLLNNTQGYFTLVLNVIGDQVDVWQPQFEEVSGLSNQAPGEYIPTNGEPVQRGFSNENGNSVVGDVVTVATGAPLAEMPGLLGQPALTNEIPYSREIVEPGWSAAGSPTLTYDQVGITGENNTATFVEDLNTGGIDYPYYTARDMPSDSTVTYRMFIKKDSDVSRFPELSMQFSGGTTMNMNMQLNTSTGETVVRGTTPAGAVIVVEQVGDWWELYVSMENSGGNVNARLNFYAAATKVFGTWDPSAVGSIVVGYAGIYFSKEITQVRRTSPIFTSGAITTLSGTQITYDETNHSDTQGAYYMEVQDIGITNYPLTTDQRVGFVGLGAGGRVLYVNTYTNVRCANDSGSIAGPPITFSADDTIYRMATAYGDANVQINIDGVWGEEGLYSLWDNSQGLIRVLSSSGFSTEPIPTPMLIRNIRRYDLPYVDAKAKIDELMAL